MKILLLLTLNICFFFLPEIYSQSPSCVWARDIGDTSNDQGNSITVDNSGNVYTTGTFTGTVDFNPGISGFTIAALSITNTFMCKHDAAGQLQWVRAFTGTGYVNGIGIGVDLAGNVYVSGYYNGIIDFDPDTSQLMLPFGPGVFMCKLTNSGNLTWAHALTGGLYPNVQSMSVDNAGNIFIGGMCYSSLDMDPGPAVNFLSPSSSVYIAKYNNLGNLEWANSIDGGIDSISIAADAGGNVYATGRFFGTIHVDPFGGNFPLTTAGIADICIVKFNSNGSASWAERTGDTYTDVGSGIATDAAGNVYAIGSFVNTVDFDPGLGTHYLTSAGATDTYLLKLDSAGNFLWAKNFGGTANDFARMIVVRQNGEIYITGSFYGTADMDPGNSVFNLTSAGNFDIYISRFDTAGAFFWAKGIGGSNVETCQSFAVSNTANVHLTALSKSSSVYIDACSLINTAANGSTSDILIVKLHNVINDISYYLLNNPVLLYPNPATGTLIISSENTLIEHISIFDIQGVKIYDLKSGSKTIPIDVEFLNNGLYFVELHSSDQTFFRKFIISR
jgi:hypothetical protein